MEAVAAAKTAFAAVQPYFSYVSAAMSVMSGLQSWQQGLNQSAAAKIKAKQVQLEADVKALNKEQEGVQLARNQQRIAASLVARAAAGNTDPFSGSAALLAANNESALGKDLYMLKQQAERYRSYGDVMSALLTEEAKSYEKAGFMGFVGSIGKAAYIVGQSYTPTDSASSSGSLVDGYYEGYPTQRQLLDNYEGPTSMFETNMYGLTNTDLEIGPRFTSNGWGGY